MQLRKARKGDVPALYTLWEAAFGDTKETVDLFFETCFQMQNTLVAVCDGQVRSVIYLLRNTLQNGADSFTASYIYAAATETARGTDFLYLVPASAHLFQYYAHCGFQTAFKKQTCAFSRAELQTFAKNAECTVPYIAWSQEVLQFSAKRFMPPTVSFPRCLARF